MLTIHGTWLVSDFNFAIVAVRLGLVAAFCVLGNLRFGFCVDCRGRRMWGLVNLPFGPMTVDNFSHTRGFPTHGRKLSN